MYIAAIPLDQKKSVVDTEQQYSIAKMENAKAEADYNESGTQLQIANNDVKSAQLTIDSAMSAKKSAEQSADTNRINNATRDLSTAENAKKAAQARVAYLTSYRNYLKRYWRYTQENMYWQEAQYEQAKAQIAKSNNIAPKGVDYSWFPSQVDERGKRTQSAKSKAEQEKVAAVNSRDGWLKAQADSDKLSGHTSSYWDPMAPKTGPQTAGNASGNVPVQNANATAGNGSAAPAPNPQ